MKIITQAQSDSFADFIKAHERFIIAGHKEPDGDFEGHWTGSARNEWMGGEIKYDYNISKKADGSWQCSVNGEAPKAVNVRGRKLTGITSGGGGREFPIELKIKNDGTLSVQMMGNEMAVLKR